MTVLFGVFAGASAPARTGHAPADSESAQADALLAQFPDAEHQSVLIVASRDDAGELTEADLDTLTALTSVVATHAAGDVSRPIVSDDGAAALLVTPIAVGEDNTATSHLIGELRNDLAEHRPDGLELQVTGGPAFASDVAAAFDGAEFTLLIVTILIVADSAAADEVVAAAKGVSGIVRAHPVAETDDGSLTSIMVVSEHSPGTPASLEQIGELREAVHDVAEADAMVGGQTAVELDARAGSDRDLLLIVPLVLAVCFIVLLVLLRSLIAPVPHSPASQN